MSGISKVQDKILETLTRMRDEARDMGQAAGGKESAKQGPSFTDHLRQGVNEVNGKAVTADKMAMDLATGKTENIHETMLAASQAELSFNLMVQLRNKALEAYSEIMRMPV